MHDYELNGLPVYKVGFADFYYISSLFASTSRFMTRMLSDQRIVSYVKTTRSRDFYIDYNGILIDFRTYKQ